MATFLPIDAGANARAAHYALAGVHSLPLAAVAKMQPPGIEPGSPAWQASIIPLDHGCECLFAPNGYITTHGNVSGARTPRKKLTIARA